MKLNNMTVEEIGERLNEVTRSLFEKKLYKEYLDFVQKFPKYSAGNLALLFDQDPNCTMVCGYEEWKTHGRHVVKGAKGLKIRQPYRGWQWIEKRDQNGNVILDANGDPVKEKVSYVKAWRKCTVFDVSQTSGKPIPSITANISGRVDGFTEVIEILKNVSPVPIVFDPDCEEGFEPDSGRICIRTDRTEQKTMQALLPSIASALLYRETGELFDIGSLEAESVAFVVAKHFCVINDYNFDYISDWSAGRSLDEMHETLRIVREVSTKFIERINAVAGLKEVD